MPPTGRVLVLLVLAAAIQLAAGGVRDAGFTQRDTEIRAGENAVFNVDVTVDGESSNLPWPDITLPSGVRIATRSRSASASSQISIANGQVNRSRTTIVRFSFAITAGRPGEYPIGPILFDGRNLGAGLLRVTEGLPTVHAVSWTGTREAFVGQQIPFSWRLASDRPFEVVRIPDLHPLLAGFHLETPSPSTSALRVERQAGRPTGFLDISGSLWAQAAGTPALPPISLDYRALDEVRKGELETFSKTPVPLAGRPDVLEASLTTTPIPLRVLDLPKEGRPPVFQGAVGSFTLTAQLDHDYLRTGEAATLLLELSGDGVPKGFGGPTWVPPADLEAYPPTDAWSGQWQDGLYISRLQRRIVLVPRHAGQYPLDSASFVFFDPAVRAYRILRTSLPLLRADDAAPATGPIVPLPSQAVSGESEVVADSGGASHLVGRIAALLAGFFFVAVAAFLGHRTYLTRYSPAARKQRRIQERLHLLQHLPGRPSKAAETQRTLLVEAMVDLFGAKARTWSHRERADELARVVPAPPDADENWLEDLFRGLEAVEFGGARPEPETAERCLYLLQALQAPLNGSGRRA